MTQTARAVQWQAPVPEKHEQEMNALRPYLFNCCWTGKVQAGGMGLGSPEMDAVGKGVFRPILDGAWLAGDFEQEQFAGGVKLITWKAHYVARWDKQAGEYRAIYFDNNGSSCLLRGYIDGDRFINETLGETPVQLRLVWERNGTGAVNWRNECSIDGGPWLLVEEYHCTAG